MDGTITAVSQPILAPAPLHAHPAAPSDAKKPFAEFVKKSESSASQPTSNGKCEEINLVYNDFWEVPSRFWRRGLEDTEIDAILVRSYFDIGCSYNTGIAEWRCIFA
jgi:hypothetical protein